MGTLRRTTAILVTISLVTLLAPRHASSDELGAAGGARALTLHDADETLRDFCARDAQGRLWLELPGGARYELVTTVTDPAIANPGDGAFHTFSGDEVRATLAQVGPRFPLASIHADILIL